MLSQFDLPGVLSANVESTHKQKSHLNKDITEKNTSLSSGDGIIQNDGEPNTAQKASNKINPSAISDGVLSSNILKDNVYVSPKHSKRKIINSHFDHQVKRKFPGPAGLLTGSLEKNSDENFCHIELLSQVFIKLYRCKYMNIIAVSTEGIKRQNNVGTVKFLSDRYIRHFASRYLTP